MWSGSVRATWSSEALSSLRILSLALGGPQDFLEEAELQLRLRTKKQ